MIAIPASSTYYYSYYNHNNKNGDKSKYKVLGGLYKINLETSSSSTSRSRISSRKHHHHQLDALVLGQGPASEQDDVVVPSHHFSSQALVPSFHKYMDMYKRSVEDPAGFWSDIAAQFYWKCTWDPAVYSANLDVRKGDINIKWFEGGITNICYNCLDKNIQSGNGDKIAIYWEANEPGADASLTYTQLLQRVCQLANYLKDIGVKKGDAVLYARS